MALEIERKFLVNDESYKKLALRKRHIIQGYLSRRKEATVRIRIMDDGARITVKSVTVNATRHEWEYPIPVDDAKEMLELCEGNIIEKTRWIILDSGMTWEIDEFHQPKSKPTVAEIELDNEDSAISLPSFIGMEVTGDPAYYNSNL